MGTGDLPQGIKWAGRETDHSPPTIAEIKYTWRYTSTLHAVSWRGTC
jgi:hypothetical protein